MERGTQYPLHSHSATEIYHVLKGSGVATNGTGQTKRVSGDIWVHEKHEHHAFNVDAADTLLIAWAWFGEISDDYAFVVPSKI
jgi:quercetin dioxygenase-like cupin family protein